MFYILGHNEQDKASSFEPDCAKSSACDSLPTWFDSAHQDPFIVVVHKARSKEVRPRSVRKYCDNGKPVIFLL